MGAGGGGFVVAPRLAQGLAAAGALAACGGREKVAAGVGFGQPFEFSVVEPEAATGGAAVENDVQHEFFHGLGALRALEDLFGLGLAAAGEDTVDESQQLLGVLPGMDGGLEGDLPVGARRGFVGPTEGDFKVGGVAAPGPVAGVVETK